MAQDLNREEVLIARNNETGQVGAVTGLNEDGTPKMTDAKSAKLSDLVKFSKGQNPLEAFISNFVRQCKNPSVFGFFKIPAEQYETVGQVTADLAKDPVANAAILSPYKVVVPEQEQSQTMGQSNAQSEAPAQAQGSKYKSIDESKIDWPMLKEKWGIDREELSKSGDLKEMLYNRKSKLVTVTPTFGGEKFPIDARLSFKTDADGNVKVVPHFIHREPNLSKEFEGYKFTDEDKEALRNTGNLGKVVELTDKQGNKVPSYVSIDRYTNELLSVPVKDVYVKNKIGETELSVAEVMRLKEGKSIGPKEFTTKNGKTFKAVVQVSADNKGIEFVPQRQQRMSESQTQAQGQGQRQADWLTKDGNIRPISKWAGVPLTPQQTADYVAGKVVVMSNMTDKKGQPCTVYLQFNPEKMRPFTSFNDPRVKVADESKVQKAVNNDGLTNEATKNVTEPLTKGQTQPKDEAQHKQQKKPKSPKL